MSDKLLVAYFEMMKSEQGVNNCPKMLYYSTTTKSLYVFHAPWNTASYITVSVVKEGSSIDKFELKIEQYSEMMSTINIFNEFLRRHINSLDYKYMLYERSMSTKLRKEERRPQIGDKTYSLVDGDGSINHLEEDSVIVYPDLEDEPAISVKRNQLHWNDLGNYWDYSNLDHK